MCIISKPVEKVANTKIFVAIDKNKKRQITVYSNTVDNIISNNAMILPVPYPETIKFINLADYKNIFSDCESCFYNASRSFSLSASASLTRSFNKLEVFNVGSYVVSLAMNLNDLKRVDESVFSLSDGCDKILSKTYTENYWGFIICKLKKGNENYHPFAYSHNILNNKVFIPTKHYHDNSNVLQNLKILYNNNITFIDDVPMFANYNSKSNTNQSIVDDWDHDIYLVNLSNFRDSVFRDMNSSYMRWTKQFNIDTNKLKFDIGDVYNFEKIEIKGGHKNIDLMISI